jgi:hypothetical protein
MNSRSITDYILKLEKENFDLKKDLLESEIQRVSTTLNEADESRTKIEHLKKLFKEANEEKVNALNELNDLKYKNRSYTETTARVLHKSVNQGLIDRLLELGEMTSDIYKTMTYQKAADTITNLLLPRLTNTLKNKTQTMKSLNALSLSLSHQMVTSLSLLRPPKKPSLYRKT